MYMLDPDRGRRRRGRVRDVARHLECETRELMAKGTRDVRHRAAGAVAVVRQRLGGAGVEDEVLVERVRSEVGRASSHAHAIRVTAQEGRVTLEGPVLADEASDLCARVARVRGVREVDASRLEPHQEPEHIPSLQGHRRPVSRVARARWRPAGRLVTAATGTLLMAAGAVRGAAGRAMMLGGGALLTGAFLGGRARQGLTLHKTIVVDAPVERAYALFADFENFPRFMQHVRRVKRLADGRAHWFVEGPAGIPLGWDARITQQEPGRVFGWRAEGAGGLAHDGVVRFEPVDGRAKLEIHLCYKSLPGPFGRVIAAFLGADPKRALDEDMIRFKSLLERGKTTVRGEEVTA
jgi:uncharacterized membrane protein